MFFVVAFCRTGENCNVDARGNSTGNSTHTAYSGNKDTSSVIGILVAFTMVLYAW